MTLRAGHVRIWKFCELVKEDPAVRTRGGCVKEKSLSALHTIAFENSRFNA